MKTHKPGTMVFWDDEQSPRWVVQWQPDNGDGAYWLIDAAGGSGVAAPDELSLIPQEVGRTKEEGDEPEMLECLKWATAFAEGWRDVPRSELNNDWVNSWIDDCNRLIALIERGEGGGQ